jgi:RNA polymerase sigma-70 factor (ECF subfamily)
MRSDVGDEDLARAARLGDLGSFRALVERHRGRVFSLALRMCGNREEAEDMAQEAFLKVYRGLPSFRGEAAFTTWMLRVALNTFHRHLRRLPRARPLTDDALNAAEEVPGPDPEADLLDHERAERVRRLVAGLPAPFRDAVALFYLQERSVEEAAATLGVSIGTLKSRLFRARRMLLDAWPLPQAQAPAVGRRAPRNQTAPRGGDARPEERRADGALS